MVYELQRDHNFIKPKLNKSYYGFWPCVRNRAVEWTSKAKQVNDQQKTFYNKLKSFP